jgi:hypothetical protein
MRLPETAQELQKLLEERKLYPWYAAANGTEPHDGYTLRKEPDGWVTYRYRPWANPKERHFSVERDAVSDLVGRLKEDGAFGAYVADL